MYTAPPKKMLPIAILEILRKHTDKEHTLLQSDIVELLEKEHSIVADRKAVRRNLTNLMEYGYPIDYCDGWFIEHDFADAELLLMIESILFSRYIPRRQGASLVRKIETLSSKHFMVKEHASLTAMDEDAEQKQFFLSLEVLDEAIKGGKMVTFTYRYYGTDKRLHTRLRPDGTPHQYLVSPYRIVSTNGRFFLVCNFNRFDTLAHCRIDRITDIRLLDSPAKPLAEIKGMEGVLDVPEYMVQHPYMFSGESVRVVFRASLSIVSDIIDWFGMGVDFRSEKDGTVEVAATINEKAALFWFLQYGLHTEVLEPLSLRESIRLAVASIGEKYEKRTDRA